MQLLIRNSYGIRTRKSTGVEEDLLKQMLLDTEMRPVRSGPARHAVYGAADRATADKTGDVPCHVTLTKATSLPGLFCSIGLCCVCHCRIQNTVIADCPSDILCLGGVPNDLPRLAATS